MNKKLHVLAIMLVFVFVLAACSSATEEAQTGNQEGSATGTDEGDSEIAEGEENAVPKEGGTLLVAIGGDPDVLNPLYANDRFTLTVNQSLFAPLYTIRDGEKQYALAESFTQEDDNVTYTIKLKDNLYWHDGEKITADDIIFTIDSILDENQNSSRRSRYIFDGIPLTTTKVDELTVQLVLPQVSAAFEGNFNKFTPIPKHVYENETDISKSEKNQSPIGSGPFKFKEYKAGEYVALERFDDYFDGKAHLDSVVYRIAKDPNSANIALQNGEISLRMIDPQDYQSLNTDLVSQLEVRQAIAHAIDKDELITAAFISSEFADPASSIFTPDTLYQTDDIKSHEYDQDKAKELLQNAGVTNQDKIRIAYSNNNKVAQSMALYTQQKLQEVGLGVDLIAMDPNAYSNIIFDPANTDYDITFGGYIMGAEPDGYQTLYLSDADYNYARYKNAAFDELWKQAAIETDSEARAELYKQIQQTVGEDLPYLPIAYPKAVVAVDKKFTGLEEAIPIPIAMFEDLSKIYINE